MSRRQSRDYRRSQELHRNTHHRLPEGQDPPLLARCFRIGADQSPGDSTAYTLKLSGPKNDSNGSDCIRQLLADDYARNGFKVIIPDLFNEEPCPPDALNPGSNYDFATWLTRHGAESVGPIIRKVMTALVQQGITKIGVLGYCFGARPAFNLAFRNAVHVVVVSHPSLLKVPDDLEVRHQTYG